MATFLVSGLLHEYILAFVSLKGISNYSKQHQISTPDDDGGDTPRYFYQTAFFLWNGFLLIVENIVISTTRSGQNRNGDHGGLVPQSVKKNSTKIRLPSLVKTFLVNDLSIVSIHCVASGFYVVENLILDITIANQTLVLFDAH